MPTPSPISDSTPPNIITVTPSATISFHNLSSVVPGTVKGGTRNKAYKAPRTCMTGVESLSGISVSAKTCTPKLLRTKLKIANKVIILKRTIATFECLVGASNPAKNTNKKLKTKAPALFRNVWFWIPTLISKKPKSRLTMMAIIMAAGMNTIHRRRLGLFCLFTRQLYQN